MNFTHDSTIVSLLPAMWMDYFKGPPRTSAFPVRAGNGFNVAKVAPWGANVVTEVIACEDEKPEPQTNVIYWGTTSSSNMENGLPGMHQFIRMRLNNGIQYSHWTALKAEFAKGDQTAYVRSTNSRKVKPAHSKKATLPMLAMVTTQIGSAIQLVGKIGMGQYERHRPWSLS